MTRHIRTLGVFAALCLTSAPLPAFADMGLPPVAQGAYVSGEGGYLRQDLEGVNGHGVRPVGGGVGDVIVSPEDGWFAGGMIGFSNGMPLVSGVPFNRIEAYLLFGRTDASAADASPPLADITLKSVDGLTNIIGGASGTTTVERRTTEGGFRLEGDQNLAPSTTLTWSLAPFIRLMDEDTNTAVTGCCLLSRTGSVETWLYGATIAVEPEYWVTPGIALVGRLGAGIYGYDADGDFRSFSTGLAPPDPFLAAAAGSESGFGFRGQLGLGLKFKLFPQGLLETFAEADYFSDVGTAVFSNSIPGDITPSHVRSEDMWELRAGARLTIGLGTPN